MKTQKIFSFLCSIFLLMGATMTKAQTIPCDTCLKTVFFLHGLGGNVTSWERVVSAMSQPNIPGFPLRKAEAAAIDYSHVGSSLYDMARAVHSNNPLGHNMHTFQMQVADRFPWFQPENSMIIAHSQGGFVARVLDTINDQFPSPSLLSTKRHSAIATFGTAHQGAQIANNIKGSRFTPTVENFLNLGCNSLGNAEVAARFRKYWFMISLLTGNNIEAIIGNACAFLVPTAMNTIFEDFMIPATIEYQVGSANLTALNNYPHQVPIVLFYGEEEDPVFWRTLYSLRQSDTAIGPVGYFNQDDDDQGVVDFFKTTSTYIIEEREAKQSAEKYRNMAFAALSISGGVSNIGIAAAFFSKSNSEFYRARQHERAKDFMINANEYWEIIIGGKQINHHLLGYLCRCTSSGNPLDRLLGRGRTTFTYVPTAELCTSIYESCTATPMYLPDVTKKPNDGIVLAESAGVLNGSTHQIKMDDTNHQQMRNSEVTRKALTSLFNGEHGSHFKIDEK
jgi:hypothetical protein